MAQSLSIIRLPKVKARTALGRTTIYERVRHGTFPAPIKLAENTTAWRVDDIDKWAAARIEASQQLKATNDE